MDFQHVRLEIKDGIATLTLNHPEVMNAVSMEMLQGLEEAMEIGRAHV